MGWRWQGLGVFAFTVACYDIWAAGSHIHVCLSPPASPRLLSSLNPTWKYCQWALKAVTTEHRGMPMAVYFHPHQEQSSPSYKQPSHCSRCQVHFFSLFSNLYIKKKQLLTPKCLEAVLVILDVTECPMNEGDDDALTIFLHSHLPAQPHICDLLPSPLPPLERKMRCERKKKVLRKIWKSRCLCIRDAVQAVSFMACNEECWSDWKPWPPASHCTCSHLLLWEVKSGAAAEFHFKS